MSIDIKTYPYGMYGENTYLVSDLSSTCKAIIDPGWYSDEVKTDIGDPDSLKYILLTHGHQDHFNAISKYMSVYPKTVFAAPEADQILMQGCPKPHNYVSEGDDIKLGSSIFKVISTPGHTAGGLCYLIDDVIFTGDTLFRLSVGRTDLPSGHWDTLQASIKNKLYTLGDDITAYPGHGEPTTIGYEKKANPFV